MKDLIPLDCVIFIQFDINNMNARTSFACNIIISDSISNNKIKSNLAYIHRKKWQELFNTANCKLNINSIRKMVIKGDIAPIISMFKEMSFKYRHSISYNKVAESHELKFSCDSIQIANDILAKIFDTNLSEYKCITTIDEL